MFVGETLSYIYFIPVAKMLSWQAAPVYVTRVCFLVGLVSFQQWWGFSALGVR